MFSMECSRAGGLVEGFGVEDMEEGAMAFMPSMESAGTEEDREDGLVVEVEESACAYPKAS